MITDWQTTTSVSIAQDLNPSFFLFLNALLRQDQFVLISIPVSVFIPNCDWNSVSHSSSVSLLPSPFNPHSILLHFHPTPALLISSFSFCQRFHIMMAQTLPHKHHPKKAVIHIISMAFITLHTHTHTDASPCTHTHIFMERATPILGSQPGWTKTRNSIITKSVWECVWKVSEVDST